MVRLGRIVALVEMLKRNLKLHSRLEARRHRNQKRNKNWILVGFVLSLIWFLWLDDVLFDIQFI